MSFIHFPNLSTLEIFFKNNYRRRKCFNSVVGFESALQLKMVAMAVGRCEGKLASFCSCARAAAPHSPSRKIHANHTCHPGIPIRPYNISTHLWLGDSSTSNSPIKVPCPLRSEILKQRRFIRVHLHGYYAGKSTDQVMELWQFTSI